MNVFCRQEVCWYTTRRFQKFLQREGSCISFYEGNLWISECEKEDILHEILNVSLHISKCSQSVTAWWYKVSTWVVKLVYFWKKYGRPGLAFFGFEYMSVSLFMWPSFWVVCNADIIVLLILEEWDMVKTLVQSFIRELTILTSFVCWLYYNITSVDQQLYGIFVSSEEVL